MKKFLLLLFIATLGVYIYSMIFKDKKKTDSNQIEKIQKSEIITLKKNVDKSMKTLLLTLENIKDLESTKSSLPILDKITNDLKKYEPLMYKASTKDRRQIKQYVTDFIPHLEKPLTRVRDIEGATPIIEPKIEKLEDVLILYKIL